MPFTPTHVVAVVPIARLKTGIPLSALAIGSMVPDLPLFFHAGGAYRTTHSLPGLFTLAAPLGVLAFLLYQGFVKRAVIELLPRWVRERLGSVREPVPLSAPGTWLLAAFGALVGAATHVFWDSFTHAGRWGVSQVAGLSVQQFSVFGRGITGYKALQYGSTLVFLPLLVLLVWVWLRRQPVEAVPSLLGERARRLLQGALVGLPVLAGLVGAGLRPTDRTGFHRFMLLAFDSVSWGGAALIVLVLAYGVGFALLRPPVSAERQATTEEEAA